MKFSKCLKKYFILFVIIPFTASASEVGSQTKVNLFSKLSEAGINQIVELPYNESLISKLGDKVKVHNIVDMQNDPQTLPEPTSLRNEFQASFKYYTERKVIPSLTYKVGEDSCAYMEAVKVSDILVCYRKARSNFSALAPVHLIGPQCTTVMAELSHCYIFAHQVDDVVRAISTIKK